MAQKAVVGQLSEERMREIALLVVKQLARKESIKLSVEEIRRRSGVVAKEIGIETEEAFQFSVTIFTELFDEFTAAINKK